MGLHARASLLTARVRLIVALSPPVCQPGICMAANGDVVKPPDAVTVTTRSLVGRLISSRVVLLASQMRALFGSSSCMSTCVRLELIEDACMYPSAVLYDIFEQIVRRNRNRSRGEECGVEESSVVVMPDGWDLETPTELRHISSPRPHLVQKESWF